MRRPATTPYLEEDESDSVGHVSRGTPKAAPAAS